MTINVKAAIEREYGKQVGGSELEKFEIRFWLSTEANGRTVESRGTTVTIELPSRADAREFVAKRPAYIEMRIQNDGLDAKQANAKLPEYVSEVMALDAQWNDTISKTFDDAE
jgi:hypothetical protein